MKLKLKKKNCFIALIIVLILILEILNPFKLYSVFKIKKLNYSTSSASLIIKYGLKEKVLNNSYNEFIDKYIFAKDFNVSNYTVYNELNYYKNVSISQVNELIVKGYNSKEINCILMTGNYDSISSLLKKDKYENIDKFLCYEYANLSNLDRYITYQQKTLSNYDESVLNVEIGLDKTYYDDSKVVSTFSYDMLVNKYFKLESNFIPDDLVKVKDEYSIDSEYGNATMLNNFYQMADDLNKELDLKIYVRSGYRSYKDQEEIYNTYYKLYGQKYVNNYVARAGFSEHQTGLALDIKASSSKTFDGTKESEWLKKNAYKYGFIHRYTKANESITGYKFESWHYRYVGIEIAKVVYDKNITYEEYCVKYGK